MESRKYSIVMPVYRVENYLEKIAAAIQEQTYSNWELILVDDCSDDSSGKLCDRLKEKEERIQVLHLQENKGLSNARNEGMANASGDYILFLDSDDTVDTTLLENIDQSLNEQESEVVVYGLIEEYENEQGTIEYTKPVIYRKKYLKNAKEVHREVIRLEQRTLFGYAWNKAYRLSYLREQNLRFENITMIEDVVFNAQVFQEVKSVNILPVTPYHYAIRNRGNLTSKYLEEYFPLHVRRISLFLDLYESWNCLNPKVMKCLANIYCRYFLSALQRNCDPQAHMNGRKKRKWVKDSFQSDVYRQLMPYLSPDNKLLKVLAVLVRRKSVIGCWVLGQVIYQIKTRHPGVFARLKQNR